MTTSSLRLSNNGLSTLASGITSSATSITVATGDGSKFPALSAGQYFMLTLVKSTGTFEIVKVTARSGDVLTVTRAQEGTTAAAFSTGDRMEHRLTAGSVITELENKVQTTGDTASAIIPKGTTAQRDASPSAGLFRFNEEQDKFEGYNSTGWGEIGGGGGAKGGGTNQVFFENDIIITDDYTITTGKNAVTAGPVTINDGVTVTIPDGSTWTIV